MKNTGPDRLKIPASTRGFLHGLVLCLAVGFLTLVLGCGKSAIDNALNSDANGFVCAKCPAKFYLPADTFPGHCPKCKAPDITMVIGYVCEADQHVTIAPRRKRGGICEKCGKSTSALSLPREADLKAWGGVKVTNADVN